MPHIPVVIFVYKADRCLNELYLRLKASLKTLTKDFEIVGTFRTAERSSGFKEARLQQILKPIRPVNAAVMACTDARANKL